MFFLTPLNLIGCIQCRAPISMVHLNLRRRIDLGDDPFCKIHSDVHPYGDFNDEYGVVPIPERFNHGEAIEWDTIETNVHCLCKEIRCRPAHYHPEEEFDWYLLVHTIKSTFNFFKLSRFCVAAVVFRKDVAVFGYSSSAREGSRSAATGSRSARASWMALRYSRATATSPPSRSRYVFHSSASSFCPRKR